MSEIQGRLKSDNVDKLIDVSGIVPKLHFLAQAVRRVTAGSTAFGADTDVALSFAFTLVYRTHGISTIPNPAYSAAEFALDLRSSPARRSGKHPTKCVQILPGQDPNF